MATEKRLIDANDALERLQKAEKEMKVVSIVGCKAVPMDGVIEFIETRPTVDAVEVVHGRWEDRENPQWKAYDIRHCSVCGWNIPKTKLRQKDSHWNYCPNCGAKMDGDGDG